MTVVGLHPEELLDKDARGVISDSERVRLEAHIAQCSVCRVEQQMRADRNKRALILRNHGLLVHGPTIPEAFRYHYQLQRACEVQVATSAIDEGIELSRAVIDSFRNARNDEKKDLSMSSELVPAAKRVRMLFDAMVRLVDKKDTSYRN